MSPSKNNLDILRHSTSHLMAAAIQKLWPQAKFGIGPVIENGFYYDIEIPNYTLKEEDLPKIEHQMQQLIKQNIKFDKKEMSVNEAIKLFKKLNQTYKVELLKDIKAKGTTKIEAGRDAIYGVSEDATGQKKDAINRVSTKEKNKVTIYTTGDFTDLCRGPHVKSTKELSKVAFKLERLAGAYWRGSEKNNMLTRIYGIAFESQVELKKYLKLLAEAEKRDHRKLGQELDLFMVDDEVGQGLILWLPKGALLRQLMENFVLTEYQRKGYQLVMTPHIASSKLFEHSGHLGFYKESMYSPMDIEGTDYFIKPMNCPFHIKMYQRDIKSYRDLPLRYTELGTVYRYERSGTLHGLTRVRGFTQDDAHIICTREQLTDELVGVIELTKYILETFGFDKFKVVLSVRDPKNKSKYLGQDKDWQLAEAGLKKALEKSGWPYEIEEGEAVFYGPKIDVKVFDAVGREWQISTLQLDFNLPERFKMTYIDKGGKEKQPLMLHRALLGSLERFAGVLIEHYAGAFPLWLSPTQIVIIPVGSAHQKHAHNLAQELQAVSCQLSALRVEVWDENETVANKIRKAIAQKIPYMLVIGDKEIKSPVLHVRQRNSDKVKEIPKDKFTAHIQKLIQQKSLKL